MIKFNIDYKDTNTYPITAKEYLKNLCLYCGVELGTIHFINDDFIINSPIFDTTITCKAVLIEICKLMGGFATIGRDNKLYLKNLDSNEPSLKVIEVNNSTVSELDQTKIKKLIGTTGSVIVETIDGNTYDTYTSQKEYGPINFFLCKSAQNNIEDVIKENTDGKTTKLVINSSALIQNQEEMDSVAQNLWIKLFKGFKYKPFNIKYYGFPYLDIGDRISIYDLEDNEYSSFIFNHSFTFNGNFFGEIVTEAVTETQQEYNSYGSLSTALKQLKSSTLENAKQTATQLLTEFNGGYVVKKGGELFIADNQELDKAIKVWRWNINGLGYSKSGIDGPYELAITMNGQIVADFITAGTMSADRILGGTFKVGGEDYGNGTIEVLDNEGNTVILLNKNGITLTDGTKLIGNQGLLSNLQYKSTSEYGICGFTQRWTTDGNVEYPKLDMVCDVFIPSNFQVTSAYATIYHSNMNWFNQNNNEINGYCRKIKLYKASTKQAPKVIGGYGSSIYTDTTNLKGSEISGAFGTNGYTATNTSGNTIESKTSSNIASSITTGTNVLFVRTAESTSASSSNWDDALKKTGRITLVVDVYGYMKT